MKSCKAAQKKTRQTAEIFGLGNAITDNDAVMTGARLPTYRQVLRCFMYHTQPDRETAINKSRWEAAKVVLAQIKEFYMKAGIPIIAERKACERIIELQEENGKLRNVPLERRESDTTRRKPDEMNAKLEQTFPLWPANAEVSVKNPDDLAFLKSMKEDRVATFSGKDMKLANRLKRSEERKQKR